jgi:hypothetical protein
MKLSNIPTGTLSGTLVGDFALSGQLQGSSTQVQTKPGTTHITGTATSTFGVYPVDLTRKDAGRGDTLGGH